MTGDRPCPHQQVPEALTECTPCPASALSDKQSHNPLLQLALTIPTSAVSGVPKSHKDTTIHMKIRQAKKERDRIAFKTSEGVARGLRCTPDELVIKKYRDLSLLNAARRSLKAINCQWFIIREDGRLSDPKVTSCSSYKYEELKA
ncbi:hypothetical protein Pmani_027695 [Petrolisthes manimaculis]|uniref:Uncharacterized protein n=1 Tax=Petrolisthes manimaculis TaxID=1843537 RepID=A0AAE1P3T3_9EUCA|nr:hypothetical protein Pmani_027695 [Petrolisthes manimaculis]